MFFCKQKTAYELRISDWSSDVCSSDLPTGELYTPPNSFYNANIFGRIAATSFGDVNPRTNLPWTRADLAQFNGGNWALRVEAVGEERKSVEWGKRCR